MKSNADLLKRKFSFSNREELRNLGHDILTVSEANNSNKAIPDDEVLAFATTESRVVLTLNRRDFIRLHNVQPKHAGVIVCTYDPDFIGQAQRIHEAISKQSNLDGQLIRINRPQK